MLYEPTRRGLARPPMVVMLHGCRQSASAFAAGTRMNEAAEESGVFVLYPEQTCGANALRCSLLQMAWIAIAVCIALPLLVRYLLVTA